MVLVVVLNTANIPQVISILYSSTLHVLFYILIYRMHTQFGVFKLIIKLKVKDLTELWM